MFDYANRRRRLSERMEAEGIDAIFLSPPFLSVEDETPLETGMTFNRRALEHDEG